MFKKKFLIGTRGSQLALWQANWIKKRIIKKYNDISVELVVIKTKGDKILNVPLNKVGGKGLFIKEIEEELLKGAIDIAVHSMKDMPSKISKGLSIGAIPIREDSRDVLICNKNFNFLKFPKGARIGTSSLRRAAQLLSIRPDFKIIPIRGNLGTRIDKLKSQELDAIVLAAAGLIRLGLKDHIGQYLDTNIMLPAVGQGALCIEIRDNDYKTRKILNFIDNKESKCVVLAERSFLSYLDGGCQLPIAANGVLKTGKIVLTGLVSCIDGSVVFKKTLVGSANYPEEIGTKLAKLLISLGANNILSELL